MSLITAKCILAVAVCAVGVVSTLVTDGKSGAGWVMLGLFLIFCWEEA